MGAIVDNVYQSSSSGEVSRPIVLTMSCICTVSPLMDDPKSKPERA